MKKLYITMLAGLMLFLAVPSIPVSAMGAISIDTTNFFLDEDAVSPNFSHEFNVSLIPAPSAEVTTSFSTNGECLLGYSNQGFTTGGSVVTQNDKLHFGIRTLDDSEFESAHTCEISFSAVSATDPNYSEAVVREYSFAVTDNDIAGIEPGFTVVGLSASRMREGASLIETYQLQVAKAAQDDIFITAIADDQCDLLSGTGDDQVRVRTLDATIAAGSLNAVNFSLIPREDTVFEGIHQCRVQHVVATDDPEYSAIVAEAYVTAIADNDVNPDIPDEREYEGGLIYFKDANYDGIDDVDQPQVFSFINEMNGNRQAIVVNDKDGHLSEQCRLDGNVTSEIFDSESQSSQIVSSQGELLLAVACDDGAEYELLWLLDKYYPEAPGWAIYRYDAEGHLLREDYEHIIYSLGADFTSAIRLIDIEGADIRLIQSADSQDQSFSRTDEGNFGTAATGNSGSNNFLIVLSAAVVLAVSYWLYRRYLRLFDSKRTTAPDIDRY